jgi:hypothetical protein
MRTTAAALLRIPVVSFRLNLVEIARFLIEYHNDDGLSRKKLATRPLLV